MIGAPAIDPSHHFIPINDAPCCDVCPTFFGFSTHSGLVGDITPGRRLRKLVGEFVDFLLKRGNRMVRHDDVL